MTYPQEEVAMTLKIVQIRELATDRILWSSVPTRHPTTIQRLMNGALRNLDRDRCVVEVVDHEPPKDSPGDEE